jgi:glycosyltransferase involved in cell wall biosynthesis
MNQSFAYLPQNERKKILLICDDIRVHSGVATVARELVLNTAQHFNWVNVGGAINHPEVGKRLDLSPDTNNNTGLTDSSIILYPSNGYGDARLIRQLIQIEKPDAIFLITDPRYFIWLFQIENEIRKKMPIIYLNIWDDYPAPMYNRSYYESCDALLAISKQTKNINTLVLGKKAKKKIIEYVPHGLNENIFKPLDNTPELKEFKKKLFGNKEIDFALFFNSRNIRRKQIPDTMLAYKLFIDGLPEEQAKKCAFVLHTQVVDDNGTDLEAVRELLFGDDKKYNIIFSPSMLPADQMNLLYNSTDCQILLTNNEGWGLSLTEALLVGNPIIANVTGGMQDQMRFSKKGKWIDFDANFPSNHTGTIKEHGEWAFPVYPTNRSIQGSPLTPYIWDDRCNAEDAAKQIRKVYNLSKEERKTRGLKGREWALSDEAGFTALNMGKKVIKTLDKLFKTWKPREKYELVNANEIKPKTVPHELVY